MAERKRDNSLVPKAVEVLRTACHSTMYKQGEISSVAAFFRDADIPSSVVALALKREGISPREAVLMCLPWGIRKTARLFRNAGYPIDEIREAVTEIYELTDGTPSSQKWLQRVAQLLPLQ